MKLRRLICCLILQATLFAQMQPSSAEMQTAAQAQQMKFGQSGSAQASQLGQSQAQQVTQSQLGPPQTQQVMQSRLAEMQAQQAMQSQLAETQAKQAMQSQIAQLQTPQAAPPYQAAPVHPPQKLAPKKQTPPSQLGKSQLVNRPKRELFRTMKLSDLPQDTKELADQLEITDQLKSLYDSSQLMTNEQRFLVREKIIETILEAYLDAESVQAEADREQGRLNAVRQKLSDKRDHAINLNNATNFISSGTLNTIGSVLGFDKSAPPFPGNVNQMLSGVVAMGMSTYSLKQQRGGKIPGIGAPTMLAELFGRPTDEQTTYPESVWRFFHGNSPDAPGLTRAQYLERDWIERGHLEAPGTRRAAMKLDLVCGVITKSSSMTIDDLSDEISMLDDISTIAELMGHHLRDLLRMVDSDIVLNNE